MIDRYRFDPTQSRFTVQAFATGLLSALGHSPTFVVRDYSGEVRFVGGEVEGTELDLTVNVDSLELEDRVGASDRREIEDRMRRDVLETEAYREITFQAAHLAHEPIAPGRVRLRLGGPLTLHGATHPHSIGLELLIFSDGVRLRGDCLLRLSDYGIRPVTALGGAIKLKDDLRLTFDIVAIPEGT